MSEKKSPLILETPDVKTGRILALVAGFLVFAALVAGVLRLLYGYEMGGRQVAAPRDFPNPRLQENPAGDLQAFRDAQASALGGHTTPPRPPIARAMEAVVARGPQAYDPVPQGGAP